MITIQIGYIIFIVIWTMVVYIMAFGAGSEWGKGEERNRFLNELLSKIDVHKKEE